MWLREIPDTLLTKDLYDMFICAAKFKDDEINIQKLQQVLVFLPPKNFYILNILFAFLKKIHLNSNFNKMHAENLAIVFSPNILKPNVSQGVSGEEELIGLSLENASSSNKLVVLLITQYDRIFGVKKKKKLFFLIFFF